MDTPMTMAAEPEAFTLHELEVAQARSALPYLEFIRSSDLSLGLYVLPAGAVDLQVPHSEDEAYYIVRGRGTINVAGGDRPVERGSVVYVPARVEHRFHSILEDLTILVAFGPAEGSRA